MFENHFGLPRSALENQTFSAIFKHCAKVVAEMGGLNLQVQSRIGVSTTSRKGS